MDIHNLYCQIHNFSISFETIIQLYPLERVREIHVSGGSWEDSAIFPEKKIRRDTHDSSVPEEVFNLLEVCINKCPNLKYVVLEQLGNGLKTETSKKLFFQDFLRLEKIVQQKNKNITDFSHHPFLPKDFLLDSNIVKDEILYQQQIQLSNILETSNSYEDAIHRLNKSTLANSDWKIENWEPHMIETAICIAQKWKC